jgi:hypothetical protein
MWFHPSRPRWRGDGANWLGGFITVLITNFPELLVRTFEIDEVRMVATLVELRSARRHSTRSTGGDCARRQVENEQRCRGDRLGYARIEANPTSRWVGPLGGTGALQAQGAGIIDV